MNFELITSLFLIVVFFIGINYIAFKKKVSKKISGVVLAAFMIILLSIAAFTFSSAPYGPGEAFAAALIFGFVFIALLLLPFLLPVFVFRLIKNELILLLIYLPGSILLFIILTQFYLNLRLQ